MTGARIGTSGWSYPHWQGVFYPAEVKSARWLEFYATQFDCVELNSSFYHLPQEKTVQGWAGRAPKGFCFCPKLSRFITHQKKLAEVEEPLALFCRRFRPLKGRLGPALVQLPPSLAFHADRARAFLRLLGRRRPSVRWALEARHESWLAAGALNLLREFRVALVTAHSDGRWPYAETPTTDFVYLRFHGVGGRYGGDYPDAMLADYADKIGRWLAEGLAGWAFFNNDAQGFAVKNARRLHQLLQERCPAGQAPKPARAAPGRRRPSVGRGSVLR